MKEVKLESDKLANLAHLVLGKWILSINDAKAQSRPAPWRMSSKSHDNK
ncbi:hypothetical protein [Pseudomonas sp. I2]